MRKRSAIVFVLVVCAACGTSGTPQKPDAAAGAPDAALVIPDGPAPDAFASTCGMPGDVGNELGVGKYCATLGDCSNNKQAGLCSNLGDDTTHFCTKFCAVATGPADCGTGATCTCNAQNQCGCTPTTCL